MTKLEIIYEIHPLSTIWLYDDPRATRSDQIQFPIEELRLHYIINRGSKSDEQGNKLALKAI